MSDKTMTSETNPKGIKNFMKWSDPKIPVYSTEKVKRYFPVVGTKVELTAKAAEKWIKRGWGTKTEPKATKA